jgi:phosphoglycolate phosphatase
VGFCLTKALIFDFDGTLVDSEQSIYQCFLNITTQLAPKRIEYATNILIGPPLRDTASEILGPEHQDLLDEFVRLFIIKHDEQVIQHTKPYPGVIEVLEELYIRNIPMALATNKRLIPTKKLIELFGWNNYFKYIECSDSESIFRNKDVMIKDLVSKNYLFHDSYFIGDTVNDGLSANRNKLHFIKASYGYGKNQDWNFVNIYNEIDKFTEILKII